MMSKKMVGCLMPLTIAATLVIGDGLPAQSQIRNRAGSRRMQQADSAEAKQFEAWVEGEGERLRAEGRNAVTPRQPNRPSTLQTALMQRLQAGREITDKTAIEAVNILGAYETARDLYLAGGAEAKSVNYAYPETRRLLAQLIPYARRRPNLQARLYEERAQLLRIEEDRLNAARDYERSIELLNTLEPDVDVDLRLANSTLQLAQFLNYEMKQKPEAEKLYWQVIKFHWPVERGGNATTNFGGLQRQAYDGLLWLHRGDLKALDALMRNPAFPSTPELMGKLQKSIVEAGGSKTAVADFWTSKGWPDLTGLIEAAQQAAQQRDPNLTYGTEADNP